MIWLIAGVIVVLGGFCAVLYVGQEKRQVRHDEQVAKLVQQITRNNAGEATLKAMKMASEVLSDTVDKVTSTIGTSFATATGLNSGGAIIEPPDVPQDGEIDDDFPIPDVEMDRFFADADTAVENGFIGGRAPGE